MEGGFCFLKFVRVYYLCVCVGHVCVFVVVAAFVLVRVAVNS